MVVRLSVLACALALLPAARAQAAGQLTAAAGLSPAQIRPAVQRFRDEVSAPRTVTWDDVPDTLAEPATLPPDFYAARGLMVRGSAGDQRVSMDGDDPADPDPDQRTFSDQQAGYATQLKAFSKDRLFAPFGSETTEFSFRSPGGAPAYTSAFGLVLTDVDTPGSRVVFLTPDGESLGSFDVPTSTGAGTLSFLGVTFDDGERVGAVRVIAGSGRLGTADGPDNDVVALDDAIYGQPQATPPAPTLQLAASRIEASERTGRVYVQVRRSGDLDRVSRVRLTSEPGTATLDDDYTPASSTLMLPRGGDRATAVLTLVRSPEVEPEESFTVALSAIRGAVVGEPARATVVVAADPRGGAGGSGTAANGPVRPVFSLGGPAQVRLRRVLRTGLRTSLTSDRDAFAELTLSRGRTPILRRTVKLAAGERLRLRLRVRRRRARRALRRAEGNLSVVAVVTDARNGTKVTAARAVRLLLR